MLNSTPSDSPVAHKCVPALARGIRILDMVAKSNQPLTISALTHQLGLPKSTVHGLCSTLVHLGVLRRRNDMSFLIGPHVMRWTNAFLLHSDLGNEFYALWDNLQVLENQTITLSVLDGNDVVYIGCRNSASILGITFRIGMRLPAVFTATGKAILSTMSDAEIDRILGNKEMPALLTPNSVKSIEKLKVELQSTRERGFSIDDCQVREGMYCFGSAVLDSSNTTIAGVAVSLHTGEINDDTVKMAGQSVCKIARQLSSRLGATL